MRLNAANTFEKNVERFKKQNIGGFEFPFLGNGDDLSRRLAANLLLKPDTYSPTKKLYTPLLYSDQDVKDFNEFIKNPENINKEFDILEKLSENMQIYQKNRIPEDLRYPNSPNFDDMSEEQKNKLISANPGLRADAQYHNIKIEDSKLFNLLPPLLNKYLFEGFGQNKAHKWDLMNHTRNVLLNLHKIAENKDDALINELKNLSSRFKTKVEDLNFTEEDKENLLIAGLFHDLGKNSGFFHLKVKTLNKESALMDSFDYLKYFLDRVDGQNGFSKERKSTIVKILVAKEIFTGRTSWLDQLNDNEKTEIYSKISADDKVLKPALVLGVADILSHKGDAKWISTVPSLESIFKITNKNLRSPNQNEWSDLKKNRLELVLDSFENFADMDLRSTPHSETLKRDFDYDFSELYELMLKYSKKESRYKL